MNNPSDINAYVLGLSAIICAMSLVLVSLYILNQDRRELLLSVNSNIISVLISFVAIYFFLERQGVFLSNKPIIIENTKIIEKPISMPPQVDYMPMLEKLFDLQALNKKIEDANKDTGGKLGNLQVTLEHQLEDVRIKIGAALKEAASSIDDAQKKELLSQITKLIAEKELLSAQIRATSEVGYFYSSLNEKQAKIIALEKERDAAVTKYKQCEQDKSALSYSCSSEAIASKDQEINNLKALIKKASSDLIMR